MTPLTNWQLIALRKLIADTHELTQSYNEFFNETTDPGLKELFNTVTPNIIAVKMLLQDTYRAKSLQTLTQ